mmetsp:Transcript_31671/g.97790  ORF Transcript_31671/g.97790 Transcript_31671/m.97790 type:complete len:195 (-) Transcript_31671:37-621(-)
MTTAHRPTLPGMAAREHGNEFGVYGTGGVRSMQMPARDLPSQTKMKYRAGHQLEGILDDRAAVIEKTDALERKADAPLLTAEPHVAPDKDRLATSEAFAPGDLDAYDDDDDDRDLVFARAPSGRVDWRSDGQAVDEASSVRLASVREEPDEDGSTKSSEDLPQATFASSLHNLGELAADLGKLVVDEGFSLDSF